MTLKLEELDANLNAIWASSYHKVALTRHAQGDLAGAIEAQLQAAVCTRLALFQRLKLLGYADREVIADLWPGVLSSITPKTKAQRQAESAAALEAQKARAHSEADEAGRNYVRLVNLRYEAEAALERIDESDLKTVLSYLMAALIV